MLAPPCFLRLCSLTQELLLQQWSSGCRTVRKTSANAEGSTVLQSCWITGGRDQSSLSLERERFLETGNGSLRKLT